MYINAVVILVLFYTLFLFGGGPLIGGFGLSPGFIKNIGAFFKISGTETNRIIDPRINT